MTKFTGCRIVHRDCCCSSATHAPGVFTLQQWDDIIDNEKNGTPFPAERWPEASVSTDDELDTYEDDRDSDEWDSWRYDVSEDDRDSDERDSYVQHLQKEECYQWRASDGRKKFVCEGRSTPMGEESCDVIDWNRAYAARFESDVNFDSLYSGPGSAGWLPADRRVVDDSCACRIQFYQENLQRCYLAEELRMLMGGCHELRDYTSHYPDGCSLLLRLFIATQS